MSFRRRLSTVAIAAAALVALGVSPATAHNGGGGHDSDHGRPGGRSGVTSVVPLLPPHGNPEGVAWDRATRAFFVGTIADGTIYRGTLDSTAVSVLVPGATGKVAVGMKVSRGRLYVATGPNQQVRAYDTTTGALVATFAVPGAGFLNDLVVTGRGDIYVTDSFVPTLWHLTAAQVAAGTGTATGIPVGPEIAYVAGQFNLNGIVAYEGGRELVVVQSVTGQLFRIRFSDDAGTSRTITRIDGATVAGGDGMIVDRGRLVVVQGSPAQLTFVKLTHDRLRARVEGTRTDPSLVGPSTIARARDRYLVVNANFTGTPPFSVANLAR